MKKIVYVLPFLIITIVAIVLSQSQGKLFSKEKPLAEQASTGDKDLADYYNQASNLATTNTTLLSTTFLAAGDISLSRNIAQTIKTSGSTSTPFKGIESLLASTDFNFANLESPFGGHDRFTPKDTLVFNAPSANVAGLVDYNFKVLTLANNHALDQGVTGVTTTQKILQAHGIHYTGIGETLDAAWTPVIYESNGIVIGFIGASYSSVNDNGKTTNTYVARIEDTERLQKAISLLRPRVDYIIVTMHAGTEYVREPNQKQITFAHTAIDYGADMVIGHHPHWIQTIEEYKSKYIFYSLGNFIFDQSWSQETREGLALKITLEKTSAKKSNAATLEDLQGTRQPADISRLELIPTIIDNNCCPREALSIEAREILKKINASNPILIQK